MAERINKLIRETQREPFGGIGKPEPLKHALFGFWSRRTTDEHRMVYSIEGDTLQLAQLRYHYRDIQFWVQSQRRDQFLYRPINHFR